MAGHPTEIRNDARRFRTLVSESFERCIWRSLSCLLYCLCEWAIADGLIVSHCADLQLLIPLLGTWNLWMRHTLLKSFPRCGGDAFETFDSQRLLRCTFLTTPTSHLVRICTKRCRNIAAQLHNQTQSTSLHRAADTASDSWQCKGLPSAWAEVDVVPNTIQYSWDDLIL